MAEEKSKPVRKLVQEAVKPSAMTRVNSIMAYDSLKPAGMTPMAAAKQTQNTGGGAPVKSSKPKK